MLVLLLPVLLLMLAAATGCYSWTYYHYLDPRRRHFALALGKLRNEITWPGNDGAACRHGRAEIRMAVANILSSLLRRIRRRWLRATLRRAA